MKIPKKKYRDKVRERLVVARELFADRKWFYEMFRRRGGFAGGSDMHNKLQAFYMILDIDVTALLDAMDNANRQEESSDNVVDEQPQHDDTRGDERPASDS